MELWPGYITSIRQHENDILLCAEISSKVMRNETLLSIFGECVKNFRDSREAFAQAVVGTTVLTDYSNKTYRIDDIDWDRTPSSTFSTRNGDITFIDYYRQVSKILNKKKFKIKNFFYLFQKYNIDIRDQKQPLLVSRNTDRGRRGGQQDVIALIPELCRATGLTDDMRSNFR